MRSMCDATPSTRDTAYGRWPGAGGSIRSSAAPSTFWMSSPRTSASYSTSSARLRALRRAGIGVFGPSATSGTAEVTAVARVDLDLLAGGDEQRHLDRRAGLERCRLRSAGRPVALESRLGVRHLE